MLGQMIPSSLDCDTGENSVNQMDSVFMSLSLTLQQRFQSAHDMIMNAFNNAWYPGIDWIPFNPACETVLQIGKQADDLTHQMQSAIGQASTTGGSDVYQPWLTSIFGGSGTALLIVGGLVLAYYVIKK